MRRRGGRGFSCTVHTANGAIHVQASTRTELKRTIRAVARGQSVIGMQVVNIRTRERM